MRLIDADAFIEELEADAEHIESSIARMMHYAIIKDIEHAPTIDAVEVVHGHWIDCDGYRECSKCGWLHAHQGLNYCPICGAKMDEPQTERGGNDETD